MRDKPLKERFFTLTDREKDVLRLVCQHKSYQEIADQLFIEKGTVKTHMNNTYIKLGLKHLGRDERVLEIHITYCPMFSEVDESEEDDVEIEIIDVAPEPEPFPPDDEEIIDVSPEPEPISPNGKEVIVITPETEPLSPEEEEIIDGDEMALITYTPEPKYGGKEKMKPKKKRGCARFIITLILGALMVIGAWYSWENYLKDMPIVQSIVQLINPDAVIEISSSSPSSSSSSSSSSSNSTSSDSESIIEKILPKTDPYADAIDVGDWVKQDNVWVRLSDYEVTGTKVAVNIEVWNKTGREYFFSWNAEDNFSMVDNKNNKYDVAGGYLRKVNIDIDQRMRIPGHSIGTVDFDNDSIYNSGVTDLYVDMEYFATIDEAVFHIDLNN